MKKNLWERRIPTLVALFLLGIGTLATTYVVQKGIVLTGQAAPLETPENVRITDITDSSFSVSYTTEAEVEGSISYGLDSSLGNTAADKRDRDNLSPHKIHSITADNLQPETTYFFHIISGSKTFLNEKNLFTVTTGKTLPKPPAEKIIKGKVLLPTGSAAPLAIVYLTTKNAQTVSSLVPTSGEYQIDLRLLRNNDLTTYRDLMDNPVLDILVVSPDAQSKAAFIARQKETTVPTITLSQNYDFTLSDLPLSATINQATDSAITSGFPIFTASESASVAPQILIPKDNDSFTDQQPSFRGKAQPSEKVRITIQSQEPITAEVTTDKNGNWSYRPSTPLAPGEHTISITTRDEFGILKTIKQSFTVFASGSQVTQSATPSATLTQEPPLTISPTMSIVTTPVPSPTLTAIPLPTNLPTVIPTPLRTLPPAGNTSITTVGFFGLIIALLGSILFFFARLPIRL